MFSRLLYAAETSTIKAIDARKLLAFEMRCYRRILKICWKDKVSNKVIREREKRQWTVMDLIKQRKLKLFGHICRMGDRRLIKTVMLGMVNGNRPHGRPAKRWSDDIVDWCGCSLQRQFSWQTTDNRGEESLASTVHMGHELMMMMMMMMMMM